jgi:hypothetical protein
MPGITVSTVDGAKYSVAVELSDTVDVLRAKVHQVTGCHPGQQRLVTTGGHTLDDGKTLSDYNIELGSGINLVRIPAAKMIDLDVGGVLHKTLLSTLLSRAGTNLYHMFEPMKQGYDPVFPPLPVAAAAAPGARRCPQGPLPRSETGAYQIDRDGPSFGHILNYLRQADDAAALRALPVHEDLALLALEAEYYGLTQLADHCHTQREETWEDGRKYVGEWQFGGPHGHGIMTWPNKQVYEGQWKSGLRHGQGRFTCLGDGTVYDGEWRVGNKHGQGKQVWANDHGPIEYEGQWNSGNMHGKGKKSWRDGKGHPVHHDGQWRMGKKV